MDDRNQKRKEMRIAVIGGGIGGLTVSLALNKLNIENVVYESAPVLRADGAGLALGSNAISAFSVLGIADKVVQGSNRIREFTIRNTDDKPLISRYSERILSDEFFHSYAIHRSTLHSVLSGSLSDTKIVTGKAVIDFKKNLEGVTLFFSDGSSEMFDYVIAADGINSVFRRRLVPASHLRYAGYYCWRGVADDFQPEDISSAVEYWGTGLRFGIVPLPAKQVYWFACINNHNDDPSLMKIQKMDLLESYKNFPAPVSSLIEAVPAGKILLNRISDVTPIDNYAFRRILLLGDAAHATTPNLGQGACLAIEDAATLYTLLKYNGDILESFEEFSRIRVPRAKYVVSQSRQTGALASMENPVGIMLRDLLFRMIPESVTEKQTRKILGFSAELN